jgi:hypothetical protein
MVLYIRSFVLYSTRSGSLVRIKSCFQSPVECEDLLLPRSQFNFASGWLLPHSFTLAFRASAWASNGQLYDYGVHSPATKLQRNSIVVKAGKPANPPFQEKQFQENEPNRTLS